MLVQFEYCGLLLSSEIPLAELVSVEPDRPDVAELSVDEKAAETPFDWVHHWTSGSDVVLSVAKIDGRYIVKFDDGALFEFDQDRRTVSCPDLGDSLGSRSHQLLDQVLPRVLSHLGHLMLHGSAVSSPAGAIIFVGDSGRGKSTLAASFREAGLQVLSDDCMRLNVDSKRRVSCTPTYQSLRLWPDSTDAVMPTARFTPVASDSTKRRIDLPEPPPTQPAAVAAIFVLGTPDGATDGVRISPVPPARAVSMLLAQCFRLDPTDVEAMKRAFDRCADVVQRVPVLELRYPRTYDRLPAVHEMVMHQLDGTAAIQT